MTHLLKLTVLIEAGAGLALLAVPSVVVRLLLGGETSGVGIPLGRVAGAALFALGVAGWLAHYDPRSCAARGVVSAMMLYNLGAVVIACNINPLDVFRCRSSLKETELFNLNSEAVLIS